MFEKVKGFASKVVDKVNGKVLACANAAVLAPTVLTVAANAEEPALSSSCLGEARRTHLTNICAHRERFV